MRSGNRRLSGLWLADPAAAALECRAKLAEAEGDFSEAARLLGVSRRTLYVWEERYGWMPAATTTNDGTLNAPKGTTR